MEFSTKMSGKYAIAGLGMVIGVPEKELAKRKAELPGHPMLEHAVSSPLVGLSARELEVEARGARSKMRGWKTRTSTARFMSMGARAAAGDWSSRWTRSRGCWDCPLTSIM